jgi:hypothetical protein
MGDGDGQSRGQHSGGVNGLDLAPAEDFVLAQGASEMAEAIEALLRDPAS